MLKKIRGMCRCGKSKNCSSSSRFAAKVLPQLLLLGMVKGDGSFSVLDPSTNNRVTSLYGILTKDGCSGSFLNLLMGESVISMVCSFKIRCSGKISAMLTDFGGGGV